MDVKCIKRRRQVVNSENCLLQVHFPLQFLHNLPCTDQNKLIEQTHPLYSASLNDLAKSSAKHIMAMSDVLYERSFRSYSSRAVIFTTNKLKLVESTA